MGLGLNATIAYRSGAGLSGGFGFSVLDAVKGAFGLSDPAGISMARARDTDNPYKPSSAVIPALAQAAAQQAQAAILGQGTGVNQTPVSQPVSQTFAATGPGKLEPLVQQGTQTMSLDLGYSTCISKEILNNEILTVQKNFALLTMENHKFLKSKNFKNSNITVNF